MRAGSLRQVVTVQAMPDAGSQAQDGAGQPVEAWSDLYSVRGDVEPLSGREYFSAQQLVAEVTTRVTIRYVPGITTRNRLAVQDGDVVVYYDVLDVIDVDLRHRELQLMCRVGLVDNG